MNDLISDSEFKRYADQLLAVKGCTMQKNVDENGQWYTFSTKLPNSLKVDLGYAGEDGYFLDIEGVDTGYWHTAEEESLDYHIGLAVAALKGDIAYNRSTILGLKEVCFKTEDGWTCTRTEHEGASSYIKHRKHLWREVKKSKHTPPMSQ